MGVTNQVCGCQLQQKRGSRAGRGPHSNVETRSSQASVYARTQISQACIEFETRSYADLCFDVETRPCGPRIEEQHDYRVWHKTRSSCCVVDEVRV